MSKILEILTPLLVLAFWLTGLALSIKFLAWLYPKAIAFADWWMGVIAWPFAAVWGLL